MLDTIDQETVLNTFELLSHPILIVDSSYKTIYQNKAMNTLVESKEEAQRENLDPKILKILDLYQENHHDDYTVQDIELFNKFYKVHFSKVNENIFMLFIVTDIREQFQNIMLQEIDELCSVIIIILNSDGKIIDVNDCFLEFIDMKKEKVLLNNFFETFIPGDMKILRKYFNDIVLNDTHHQHFVTPMKALNKTYRINWQISKIVKNGESYIVAIGNDVSKFLDENSDLKRQITSIKVGFNHFPFSVGYINSKGVFIKMNSRFMKMFQIDETIQKIRFDDIKVLKENIDFQIMVEHIKYIKEISYKIKIKLAQKVINVKIDIRMLSGKKESSKFYILVAQKIN